MAKVYVNTINSEEKSPKTREFFLSLPALLEPFRWYINDDAERLPDSPSLRRWRKNSSAERVSVDLNYHGIPEQVMWHCSVLCCISMIRAFFLVERGGTEFHHLRRQLCVCSSLLSLVNTKARFLCVQVTTLLSRQYTQNHPCPASPHSSKGVSGGGERVVP